MTNALLARSWPRSATRAALFVVLTFLALLWLGPFIMVIVTAMRPEGDLMSHGPFSWPSGIQWSNFTDAWSIGDFGTVYKNSLIVTGIKVPLGILVSALAAYPLAKLSFRFRQAIFLFFLLGLAVPIHVAILPLFILIKDMGLYDTLAALFPPYVAFGLPFEIFVLQGFFRTIPSELLEAARLDGASELTIFRTIMLPLTKPALATLFILDAVATWNEFLIALVMLNSQSSRTLPLGLLYFSGQYISNVVALNAGIVIAIIPLLILYVLFQRYFIAGLTAGAVRG